MNIWASSGFTKSQTLTTKTHIYETVQITELISP